MKKEITCPKCGEKQPWKGQKECLLKGCKWSNWDIAQQLGEVVCAGHTRPTRHNNDHEDDAA